MTNIPGARIIYSVMDKATGPLQRISRRMALMNKNTRASLERVSSASKRMGAIFLGAAAAAAGLALHHRAAAEDSLGGLSSMGIKNLDLLEKAAMNASNTWSKVTTTEFLDGAYAIKSGISSLSDEGVANMTRLASMTAVATKASMEDMTGLFTKGYNIFKKGYQSAGQFAQEFSAGLARSVQLFDVTGQKMAGAFGSLQGVGVAKGVGLAEQIATMGKLKNTFTSGEETGTALASVYNRLNVAGKKLGTRFTDLNGKALPLPQILNRIKNAKDKALARNKGAEFDQDLLEAWGEVGYKVISTLVDQGDSLKGEIEDISAAMKNGEGNVWAMAKAMDSGLGATLRLLMNRLGNVMNILGKALSPIIVALGERLEPVILAIQTWAAENPGMVRGIGMVVAVLGVAAVAFGVATTAALAFAAASALNPMVWVVGGITAAVAALVAAGALVYTYWRDIWAWFREGWRDLGLGDGIRRTIVNIVKSWDYLKARVNANIEDAVQTWRKATNYMAGAWETVKGGVKSFAKWLSPSFLAQKGVDLVQGLWDGIKSAWPRVKAWIWNTIQTMIDNLPLPDFIKEGLGLGSGGPSSSGIEAGPAAGQAAETARAISERTAAVTRAYQESRTIQESQTKIVLDLKNAPGLAVNRVEQQGPKPNLALAGANFGAGY